MYSQSAADATAVNPKGIKTWFNLELKNGLITFFSNGNLAFSNGPSNLLRNPPDWIIFNNWVFYNVISADKLYANDLQRFKVWRLRLKFVSLFVIAHEEN